MAIRSGMADLILRLRGLTSAGPDIYSVADVSYFSDHHCQEYLDRHRVEFWEAPLAPLTESSNGTAVVTTYLVGHDNLEATQAGTAAFIVKDGTAGVVGTASYSADYVRGIITFRTNTLGSAYSLTGRSYDVHAAAAELLEDWATHEALSFDFTTDNQSFRRSQKAEALEKAAARQRALSRPTSARSVRSDLNAWS